MALENRSPAIENLDEIRQFSRLDHLVIAAVPLDLIEAVIAAWPGEMSRARATEHDEQQKLHDFIVVIGWDDG